MMPCGRKKIVPMPECFSNCLMATVKQMHVKNRTPSIHKRSRKCSYYCTTSLMGSFFRSGGQSFHPQSIRRNKTSSSEVFRHQWIRRTVKLTVVMYKDPGLWHYRSPLTGYVFHHDHHHNCCSNSLLTPGSQFRSVSVRGSCLWW